MRSMIVEIEAGAERAANPLLAVVSEQVADGGPAGDRSKRIADQLRLGLQIGDLEIAARAQLAEERDQVERLLARVDGAPAYALQGFALGVDAAALDLDAGDPAAKHAGQDRRPNRSARRGRSESSRRASHRRARGSARPCPSARARAAPDPRCRCRVERRRLAFRAPDDDALGRDRAWQRLGETIDRLGALRRQR